MNAAWRQSLVPGLILTSLLTGLAQSVAARTPSSTSVITIHVYNFSKIDHQRQLTAEKVATGIFRKAGVEVRWIDHGVSGKNELEDAAKLPSFDLSEMQLRILPPAMADPVSVAGNVMGWAPGEGPDRQRVYVFYNRVEELALRQVNAYHNGTNDRPATIAQILGAMIAHELGHVLLNLPSHTGSGIMRGNWDLKDLYDVAYEDLLFTPQQGAVIQAELARRVEKSRIGEVAGLESPTWAH